MGGRNAPPNALELTAGPGPGGGGREDAMGGRRDLLAAARTTDRDVFGTNH